MTNALDNLPTFHGAAVVYSRAGRIAEALNAAQYERMVTIAKGRKVRFIPSDDATAIIDAMNRGDEEALKGLVNQFLHLLPELHRKAA